MTNGISIEWPMVNTLIEMLSPHHSDWLSSRIEDIRDGVLTVAAPSTPTIPILFSDLNKPVTVQWLHPRGLCDTSGTVTAIERNPLPLWIIRADTEPTLHQRRSFARLTVTLPVVLDREGHKNTSVTLDISEGGMNCILPEGESLQMGDRIETIVAIDDEPFRTIAVVVRTAVDSVGHVTAGFRFDDLRNKDADRIRHFIFNEQLRRRALERQT